MGMGIEIKEQRSLCDGCGKKIITPIMHMNKPSTRNAYIVMKKLAGEDGLTGLEDKVLYGDVMTAIGMFDEAAGAEVEAGTEDIVDASTGASAEAEDLSVDSFANDESSDIGADDEHEDKVDVEFIESDTTLVELTLDTSSEFCTEDASDVADFSSFVDGQSRMSESKFGSEEEAISKFMEHSAKYKYTRMHISEGEPIVESGRILEKNRVEYRISDISCIKSIQLFSIVLNDDGTAYMIKSGMERASLGVE